PEVAVIARIDLDHQAVLGATLEAIAAEKAAIIRGGVAVSAAQAPEAERVIVARAAAAGVPLLLEGRDLSVSVERRGPDGQRLACAGPEWSLAGLELAMPGSFQPSNALLAATAPEALRALVPAAVSVEIARSPAEALALAARIATTSIICVAGSLFLIGDVLRHLAGSDDPCSLEKGAESARLSF